MNPDQNATDILGTTGELVYLGTQPALLEPDETDHHELEVVLGVARQLLDAISETA